MVIILEKTGKYSCIIDIQLKPCSLNQIHYLNLREIDNQYQIIVRFQLRFQHAFIPCIFLASIIAIIHVTLQIII